MRIKRWTMASTVFALAAVLAPLVLRETAAAGQGGTALPACVPEGECRYYWVCRPELGQPGDPADAEWLGGTGKPRGYEADPWHDDPLGLCSGGDPAFIEVCNQGGVLSGPHGTTLNGGGEGDCAEVKFCWTYKYVETISTGGTTGFSGGVSQPGGGGSVGATGSSTVTVTRHIVRFGTKCSGEFQVCPC